VITAQNLFSPNGIFFGTCIVCYLQAGATGVPFQLALLRVILDQMALGLELVHVTPQIHALVPPMKLNHATVQLLAP